MASDFIDIRMPERICKEFAGGPSFATALMRARSGFAQANVDRPDAVWVYESGSFVKDSGLRTQLIAFYLALKGMGHTFRFRDITHYWSGCQPPSVGDIVPYAAADILPFATGDGSTTAFQLYVPYQFASIITLRKITKPCVIGSDNPGYTGPRFWKGTTLQTTGWTLDYSTGIVTFAVAPTNGQAIRCAMLFDVHARFNDDQLTLTLLEGPETADFKIRVIEELEA